MHYFLSTEDNFGRAKLHLPDNFEITGDYGKEVRVRMQMKLKRCLASDELYGQ